MHINRLYRHLVFINLYKQPTRNYVENGDIVLKIKAYLVFLYLRLRYI